MNPIRRVSDVEMSTRDISSASKPEECILHGKDLRGTWLLLQLMGISSSHSSNCTWLSLFMEFVQWVSCIAMIVNCVVVGVRDEAVVYDKVTAILWVMQCCVQYSILRRSMVNNSLPLTTIIEMGRSHSNEISGCTKNEDVKRLSNTTGYICITLAIINVVFAASAYFNNFFYRVLPLVNHMAWNLMGMLLWLIYSYSWFTPLLFVVLPAHLLTQRVHAMADFVAENRTRADFNIDRAIVWYDDLYELNRQLQQSVSPMATAALAIGGPLQIIVMMVSSENIVKDCDCELQVCIAVTY